MSRSSRPPQPSRLHSFDTHLHVYRFPADHEVAYNDTFFHHESDRAPVAVGTAAGRVQTVAPSRTARHWQAAAPVNPAIAQAAVGKPITLSIYSKASGLCVSCSCEGQDAPQVRNAGVEKFASIPTAALASAQAAVPPEHNLLQTPTVLRVRTPAGRVTALLDATKYSVGTYLLYVGSRGLLTLDVDHHGALAGGHYQETRAPHSATYEQDELVGLKVKNPFKKKPKAPTQTDLDPELNRLRTALGNLESSYEAFKRTHGYDSRLNTLTKYQGVDATERNANLVRDDLEVLEGQAGEYEKQRKLYDEIQKLRKKRVKENFNQRVAFQKVDDKTFKRISSELKDIRKTAIPKIRREREAYQKEQELRRELLEQARESQQAQQRRERQLSRDVTRLADRTDDLEDQLRAAEDEAADALTETTQSGAGGTSVSNNAGGILRMVGQLADSAPERLHQGVHMRMGDRQVKVRTLASHAPVFYLRQVKGHRALTAHVLTTWK